MYLLLETNRVLIRPLEADDAQNVFVLFQDLGSDFFRNPPRIQSIQEAHDYINTSIEDLKANRSVNWALIDKAERTLLGIWHWGRQVEDEAYIFCCISPLYMRKGYMSEVANVLMSRMSDFGLNKAIAEVPSNNLDARFFMLHFGWNCIEKGDDGYEKWEFNTKQ